MKLYFYGTSRRENREETGSGVISFAVPDIGFVFRSAHRGTSSECEYQALLSLCLFVEANAGVFKGQNLEFLGDSATVVYQVGRTAVSTHLSGRALRGLSTDGGVPSRPAGVLERIRAFKKKLGFSVHWVPVLENRAAEQAALHPTVKNFPLSEKLDTSFLEAFKLKKSSDSGLSSF
ncbi:MAG: hypothetical protein L0196_01825 [candidate division Zixibacteria bacterium]|nr:hypothetical protein [candidate division Zixibacteria bacterium]